MLTKTLPRIAAKVLQNTHCFPKNLKEKFALIEAAYGAATVEADFEKWCGEVADKNPRYPLTEYIKVIDARLGRGFAEPSARPDTHDPRVTDIIAKSYELTGFVPAARAVANLLQGIEADEILGALVEYATALDPKDYEVKMQRFFTEGAANAIILVRRRRVEKVKA